MENNNEMNRQDVHTNDASQSLDIAALQEKWGVSAEEIKAAIANVGYAQSRIEEYLVNNRWKRDDGKTPSFQKRDLNEDETY